MNKLQKGFTLIELMIVIAIIGILAAIAIPQYQDYVTRSKVTEGLSLVQAPETAVAETYQSLGHFPLGTTSNLADPNSWGLPDSLSIAGKYVTSVEVSADGKTAPLTILITYNGNVGGGVATGDTLVLTAVTGAGSIGWVCGQATNIINGKTVVGAAQGTPVPDKFLPSDCRH
ncbi:MAG: pilin [Gammaproteobacteria bacterium]